MFKSLKDKLKVFKKKAKDDLQKEDEAPVVKAKPDKVKKESKFLKKIRARKEKEEKIPGKQKDDRLPSLDDEVAGSSAGRDRLLDGESLIRDEGGIFARKITEKKLEDALFDLEMGLLESDVAQPVVEKIKDYLMEELRGAKISRKSDMDDIIEEALKTSIRRVMDIETIDFDTMVKKSRKPFTVMFVGVNGTGKTTAIARIAHRLKKNHHSVVLAAGDTFRAGAIEQLSKHADKLGLKIIKHKSGADPAAVAFDALEHARARKKDVILLDTAGRMQTNINLMDEMKKIKRVAKPDLIVYVGDALAGNDAVIQAKKFDETVGIDGIILTKIDADAKGGAALSIAYTIGKPILFIGTGQGYKDLITFDPDWMTDRLFEE
ncbi:MAG: signal recognition particle-docking protein FtsY [Thermoplasmatota archaeon]